MEESIFIELEHPIVYDPEQDPVLKLEMSRPKLKHLRGTNFKKIEAGDIDEVLKLLQSLLGKPPSFVDMIDVDDLNGIMETLRDFFDSGRKTGATA